MSAKFNSEMPTLTFKTTKNGLEAAEGYALEMLDQFPYGTDVEVRFYQRRSNPRLKLYWAILKRCVDNSENRYGSSEDLHSALKIALGYEHRVKRIGTGPGKRLLDAIVFVLRNAWSAANKTKVLVKSPIVTAIQNAGHMAKQLEQYVGDTIVLPGSISFSSMNEQEFKVFFDKAMLELETAGYPISDYLKDAEQQAQRNKNFISKTNGVRNNGTSQETRETDRGAEENAEREEAA